MPDNPPAVESSPRSGRAIAKDAIVPTLVAVSVAMPLTIAWAIALVPMGVRVIPDKVIEQATLAPESIHELGHRVVRWLVTPCAVVFVVAHLVAVPWVFSPPALRRRARRLYWLSIAALTALAVVLGGAMWIWIATLPA